MSALKDFFIKEGHLQTFSRGQVIFSSDDSQKHICYIRSGYVGFYIGKGKQLQVILKRGDVFPFTSQEHLMSCYMAMGNTKVYVLPKKLFYTALFQKNFPQKEVIERLTEKVSMYKERLIILTTVNVYARVVQWIIFAARYFKKGNKKPLEVSFVATQTELADALATTRESINRSFSKLEKKKLIQVRDDVLVIPSLKNLQKELASL